MSNEITRTWKPRQSERVYGTDGPDGFTIAELDQVLEDAKSLGLTHLLGERLTFVRYPPEPVIEPTRRGADAIAAGNERTEPISQAEVDAAHRMAAENPCPEYEPGDTTHRMHADPDCRNCGQPKH